MRHRNQRPARALDALLSNISLQLSIQTFLKFRTGVVSLYLFSYAKKPFEQDDKHRVTGFDASAHRLSYVMWG